MKTLSTSMLAALTLSMVAACAPVKQTQSITEPLGQQLQAGIGDTILTINAEKSLPNAFGNADIFGRTTPTGMITVQYLGSDGLIAKFVRNSVVINTGATTMNSTALVLPNTQTTTTTGYVGSTPMSGTSTTYGTPTVIPAHPPQAQVLPQAQVSFEIDLSKDKSFVVAGKRVDIINAQPGSLTYRIE